MHQAVIKVLMSLRITRPQRKELHHVSKRDGVPVSELVRRGIDRELEARRQARNQTSDI